MRTVLAYALYWAGDWISRVMCYFDWAWLYPIYSRLMIWSSDLDTKGKIWTKNP
jgi:hypothetical protein